MMDLIDIVGDIIDETKYAIKNFKEQVFESISFLIIVMMGLVSVITGIVAFIMFIVQGGYGKQISFVKKNGIFGKFEERFTTGTVGMLYSDIVVNILLVLLCVTFVFLVINFYKNSGKVKKTIMVIDLFLLAVQSILPYVVFGLTVDKFFVRGINYYESFIPYYELSLDPKVTAMSYLAITAALMLIYLILLLITSECRDMIKYTLIFTIFSFAVAPLIFWILQNIIALVTSIFAIIIMCGLLYLGMRLFLAGGVGEGESSYSGGSDSINSWDGDSYAENTSNSSMSKNSKKSEKIDEKEDKGNKDNYIYINDLNKFLGIKLFKVHGWMGDYIECDNGIGNGYLCDVRELEEGKVHICDKKTGREVKSSEIPWRK